MYYLGAGSAVSTQEPEKLVLEDPMLRELGLHQNVP